MQMIDSKKQKLNSAEIIKIALENTKSPYPLQVAFTAITSEMNQPKTKVQQIGNTLFILHMGDEGGYFKALNADIAPNFYRNSVNFIVWAKDLGLQTLVTEFSDERIMAIINMIASNPPMPNMGMQAFKTQNGGLRVVINLGGER